MKTRLYFALLTILALCLSGCGIDKLITALEGSGVVQSDSRELDSFNSIVFSGVGDVQIVAGATQSIVVTTDDNLIDNVETRVEDGQLIIRTKKNFRSKVGLKVSVGAPEVHNVSLSGAGSLVLSGVDSQQLAVSSCGVGSLPAGGKVLSLEVDLSGAGSADLKALEAEAVKATVSGVGQAEVFASESVYARCSGIGNILVRGNPKTVDQKASGIGEVTLVKPEAEETADSK